MADDALLPNPVLHTVEASDGWQLRVWEFTPRGEEGEQLPKVTVIAGHAMMVDSRTICRPDRPTLVSTLVDAGYRVLVPDIRGHGESGPRPSEGGDWCFDDLVDDMSRYVELAQSLDAQAELVLVGHSLFAHMCLAWLGQNPNGPVRACAALACSVWNRRFEPSLVFWLIKRAIFLLTTALTEFVGYVPVRRLRVGSADESRGFWRQFHSHMRRNAWDSRDRRTDYHAGLARIRVPLLHVMSEGDKLYARPPACSLLSMTIPARELLVVGRDDAPGELATLRPNHMGMVTSQRSKLVWHWIAGWLGRVLVEG